MPRVTWRVKPQRGIGTPQADRHEMTARRDEPDPLDVLNRPWRRIERPHVGAEPVSQCQLERQILANASAVDDVTCTDRADGHRPAGDALDRGHAAIGPGEQTKQRLFKMPAREFTKSSEHRSTVQTFG